MYVPVYLMEVSVH